MPRTHAATLVFPNPTCNNNLPAKQSPHCSKVQQGTVESPLVWAFCRQENVVLHRRTGPSSQAPSALPHRLKAPQRLPQAAPSAPQGPHPQAEDDKPLKYDFGPTQTRDDAGTSDQPKYFTRPQDGVKLKHGGPCPICLVECKHLMLCA